MSFVVVADADLRERMRCIRIVADQTPASAIGAATWSELSHVLDDVSNVGLVLYSLTPPEAPDDALEQLLARTNRIVLALENSEALVGATGIARTPRPISEESLVVMTRSLATQSSPPQHASFVPVDFLQMICMSGGSHVLVLSQGSADVGIIEVRDGEVWTAFDALGVGEDAFARLIRPEMRARVSRAPVRKERTIFKQLQELVLDSMRRIDEGRVATPPPLSAAQLEASLSTPEQLVVRIRQLNDEARRLLMARSYDEAARVLTWLAELDPASHLVRANLEQLRRLGFSR